MHGFSLKSEIEAETIKLDSGLQMSHANQADKQNGNQSGNDEARLEFDAG